MVVCIGFTFAPARAETLPRPTAPVSDHAGVIDGRLTQQLNVYLAELESKTTAQLWVVTVRTTGDVPIEEYSLKLAEEWRIGKKGKDNGCLVVVAVADRKYRIEVGYGLEGVLPDSYCDRVARAYFVPNFRQGKYGDGLYQAAVDMAGAIAKEHGVQISGLPDLQHAQRTRSQVNQSARQKGRGAFAGLLPILIIVLMVSARRRRRGFGGWAWPVLWTLMSSGRSSSRGWSSGFGGGGFGGFGGGGGGRFGGGGASGGW